MALFKKMSKGYFSDIDRFLHRFRSTRTLTLSQAAELEKHQKIFELRDEIKEQHKSQGNDPLI